MALVEREDDLGVAPAREGDALGRELLAQLAEVVRLTVTDGATGVSRVYNNPPSTPFEPLQDTSAFAACP